MLDSLKAVGLQTGILSNGSPNMLQGAVTSAGIGAVLDDILSVESVGIFKPASAVYDMVQNRFGGNRTEILFVSSNGWDAAGATGYGFNTVWVNRMADPIDRLPWQPSHILPDLTTIPELVQG